MKTRSEIKENVTLPADAMDWARQKAAQAWCTDENKHTVMDTNLAEAFAHILVDATSKAAVKENPKDEMTNLHSTMDAQVWTKEFMSVFYKLYPNKVKLDDEWIYGWFCNLIMCGYDHANWSRDAQPIYILKGNSGAIVRVFHWEPSDKDMNEAYANYLGKDLDADVDASINCVLYRWRRDACDLVEVWSGKIIPESKYNWIKA